MFKSQFGQTYKAHSILRINFGPDFYLMLKKPPVCFAINNASKYGFSRGC